MTTHRCVTLFGFLALLVFTPARNAWGAAPDLVQSQTIGVDESDYFYLGPTGMKGWMYWSTLTTEARQILVTEVRTNTPAYGVMQYQDVILGIGSNLFTNDARAAFVDAIANAEATGNGGQLYLKVYRPSLGTTNTYTVTLRELGTLSPTTPYNCPKADAILTNFCEYVYNNGPVGTPTEEPSIWAMLASGEPRYVGWATNWVKSQSYASRTTLSVYRDTGQKVWYTGYQLITLCQYKLLTGDTNVMPAIADTANFIAQGQDRHGLWGHTMAWPDNNGGELHGSLPGYGALNQAGLAGLYGLALAKKCGVVDPEVDAAVDMALAFFRAHLYIGAIDYGFAAPASGVTDSNGRMGIAAHLFRALGDKEAAKWFAMMTSTYKWRDWGHTGNEFNHCWGPMAADIGGPELAHFVQTERETEGPYYQVSLTLRRQPEGNFKAQGQQGRRGGRQGAHATGGYGVQLAANRHAIEITGAGYNTNDFWLTSEEMDEVRFAQKYENVVPTGLSTEELLSHLDCFAPKVAGYVADALKTRLGTEPGLVTNLISIVQSTGQKDATRVAALRALGTSNVWAKATTDLWYTPTTPRNYVLNWGAALYGYRDQVTQTNMLAAITQFDREVAFDMLMSRQYARSIYDINTNGLDAAGMDLYYKAAAVILSPDCGESWWVGNQNVKNWDPQIIARYADEILGTAEQNEMGYDPLSILETQRFGDGMHSLMLRASEYYQTYGPKLDETYVDGYGQHWGIYSNYTHLTKVYFMHNQNYMEAKNIIEFHCQTPKPPLNWFRNLIKTNIDNTLTNPATRLSELYANLAANKDDNLFNAVCLAEIVAHPANADPFVDITNHIGSKVALIGTHWRKHLGAVELGIADTNSVARWLAALTDAAAAGNERGVAGILHVLAGKAATNALSTAKTYLDHENDYVAMAALDVIARVGTKNELLAVFNNFLTNSTMMATSEDGLTDFVGIKNDFWCYAHWDAISGIAERDYSGCLAEVADQLAAGFNTFTTNGAWLAAIPYTSDPRTEPFSILSPSATPRKVLGYGKGIYAALGLFSRNNINCQNALSNVVVKAGPPSFYDKSHRFFASAALMSNYTIPEIAANTIKLWPEWDAGYYLLDQLLMEQVPLSEQLMLLEFNNGGYQNQDDRNYIGLTYQLELNYRRGLEEADGMLFFSVK